MSTRQNTGHLVNFLKSRELKNTTVPKSSIVTDYHLEKAKKLYRKNLLQHYGCVNAIEFSNDGNLFASGGDDRRVLLWKVYATIHGPSKPIVMEAEHRSNIFVVAFDNSNSKIFSGGNDDMVIMHDIATGKPLDYFTHEEPVYGISVDPLNDNIFATACDSGQLLLHDTRDDPTSGPFCVANETSAFHTVMFNPLEPRFIVSANAKTGLKLWDVRMNKIAALSYGGKNSEQCCMSARFSQDGSKIVALRRRLPPVLYSTQSTNHLFQFNHSGYYNSCTMKSCSFAGTRDQFVVSGSDNFDLYMWRIPVRTTAEDNRLVREAHLILRGHRSIVNQVRFNSKYSVLASSGVEKTIKFWSPFVLPHPNAKSCYETFADYDRRIYSNNDYINLILQSGQYLSFDTNRRTTREDPRMLAFFDALVQRDIEGMSDDDDYLLRCRRISSSVGTTALEVDGRASVSSGDAAALDSRDDLAADNINGDDPPSNAFGDDDLLESTDSSSSDDAFPGPAAGVSADADLSDTDAEGTLSKSSQENHAGTTTYNSPDDDAHLPTRAEDGEPKNNVITQLIAQKNDKLVRMAQTHVILEAEGKPKMKRKHMSIINRLRRLNRKTHSLTMNLLPCPEVPSSPSISNGSETSDSSSSSTSCSSSNTSSSDDNDKKFVVLKNAVTPLLVPPTEADPTPMSSKKHHSSARERTVRYMKRKQWKRSAELVGGDEQACTSATALKRQAAAANSQQEGDASSGSSSSDHDEHCADFLTRLEEVSKRLKQVTNDLTCSSSILRQKENAKGKQQSTVIRCLSSSSTTSTTDSAPDSNSDVDVIVQILPTPKKRRKIAETTEAESSVPSVLAASEAVVPIGNDKTEEPVPSTIVKRRRKISTHYRNHKDSDSDSKPE